MGGGCKNVEIGMHEQASLEGKLNHFGHGSLYLVKLPKSRWRGRDLEEPHTRVPRRPSPGGFPGLRKVASCTQDSGGIAVLQVQCKPLSPRNERRQKAIRIKPLLKENPALCRDLFAFLG